MHPPAGPGQARQEALRSAGQRGINGEISPLGFRIEVLVRLGVEDGNNVQTQAIERGLLELLIVIHSNDGKTSIVEQAFQLQWEDQSVFTKIVDLFVFVVSSLCWK